LENDKHELKYKLTDYELTPVSYNATSLKVEGSGLGKVFLLIYLIFPAAL
jgi:hypothetical protein